MKKILYLLLWAGVLTACQQSKTTDASTATSTTTVATSTATLTYSNLVDVATQEQVQQALIAAGITPKNVSDFLESVSLFNRTAGSKAGLVAQGFNTIDNLLPHYNEVAIQEDWTAKYPTFQGYNCRLTSFTLLRDFITFAAKSPYTINDPNEVLFIDCESLRNTPKKLFTPEEEKQFLTLFTEVPTTNTKEVGVHLQNIQKAWQERGISFRYKGDATKASLISVVFHSQITPEENFLFVGHVGVLVPFKEGLLFVEKLAFQEPYQAIKFADRKALNDYLMNHYNVEWNQPTAPPFVMENDMPILNFEF